MRRFEHRVAVLTGAARGIGAATALRLAREGARVEILDVRYEDAAATAASIQRDGSVTLAGGSVRAWHCDVTDIEQVSHVLRAVFEKTKRIDILVNNAGVTADNLLFKMTPDEWRRVIDTNLTSVFNCIHVAQEFMVRAKYGRIVHLSSRSALGARGQANYSAAKAGVQGITATLAIELGPYNIAVNAVAPGYIATAMTEATAERVGSTSAEHQKRAAAVTPLRRKIGS